MEIAILQASNLRELGRAKEGVAILDEMMAKDANLSTSYQFMWHWLACRYDQSFTQSNPVTMWRENRLRGNRRPERLDPHEDGVR
jgi:hypothetical protein